MEGQPPSKRHYRMGARAASARQTAERILRAAIELYTERDYADVSLDDIADRAGVTVQTVIRRFESKERLIEAAAEAGREEVVGQRNTAPLDDSAGAVRVLFEHYERWGDRVLRLLAQEERVPAFRRVTDAGRLVHRQWTERTFARLLDGLTGAERERRLAQLIAVCDVYLWKLFRRDLGLSREQAELAVTGLVTALEGGGS